MWGHALRTAGIRDNAAGAEYSRAGPALTPTGTEYPNADPSSFHTDGTSDGQWNYSVNYHTGAVCLFGGDWANPSLLFDLGESGWQGITYGRANHSLWLSNFDTGEIVDYALDGSVLGGFSTGIASALTALAMDADGTLWLADYDGSGNIEHFSTAGVHLGTQHYAGLGDALGGEIAIPEPATWALFGAGFAGFRLARRRALAGSSN